MQIPMMLRMKYELEPDNYNCPDEVLLKDLLAVAHRLGKNSLSKDKYNEQGRFCAATMQKRFGSWNRALELSGFSKLKRINIPHDELIADLRRVATELKLETVSSSLYDSHGKFSIPTVSRAFGSWPQSLSAANLKPTENTSKIPKEELFDNMAAIWESIGKQPKKSDCRPPISRFPAKTYVRRFGSWRKALESFVMVANGEELVSEKAVEQKTESKAPEIISLQLDKQCHRTTRNPGWRLRFLVNRRDNFKCRLCGKSPATHFGTVLVLDHVVSWDSGGETVMENLQTLCEVCNGGKSNLPLTV